MKITPIIFGYLTWHYGKAVRSIGNIWKNFLTFIADFFSIKLLFGNFFDPWKRLKDSYPKEIDLKKYFIASVTNTVTRIVGVLMRTVLILVGLICYLVFALIYPIALIIWLFLPLIILMLIGDGLYIIFK
jgi:hypothetical protein